MAVVICWWRVPEVKRVLQTLRWLVRAARAPPCPIFFRSILLRWQSLASWWHGPRTSAPTAHAALWSPTLGSNMHSRWLQDGFKTGPGRSLTSWNAFLVSPKTYYLLLTTYYFYCPHWVLQTRVLLAPSSPLRIWVPGKRVPRWPRRDARSVMVLMDTNPTLTDTNGH